MYTYLPCQKGMTQIGHATSKALQTGALRELGGKGVISLRVEACPEFLSIICSVLPTLVSTGQE